jgi:ferredoxin
MPTVKFVKEKKTVEVPDGANLRQEALQNGVEVYPAMNRVLHCPGLGMCTTCKVRIAKGADNVSKQSIWEKLNMYKDPFAFFARLGNEKEVRLACRTRVHGDIEVETQPPFNWHGERFWG